MGVEEAYRILFSGALIVIGILIGLMLLRSVIGPRITDRILSINMIGTMVISCISILAVLLDENYLTDVAMIYAMISFITVLIMSTIYIAPRGKRPKFGEEALEESRRMRAGQLREETAAGTAVEAAAGTAAKGGAARTAAGTVVEAAAGTAAQGAAGKEAEK